MQQYLDALKRFAPGTASQDFRVFLGELDEAAATEKHGEVGWMEVMSKSNDPARKSRAYNIQNAVGARGKFMYRRQAKMKKPDTQIQINGLISEPLALERDFTTPGRPGKLRCPFTANAAVNSSALASSTNGYPGASTPRSSLSRGSVSGRRSKRTSFHDPIRAEFCGADTQPSGTKSPSIEDSAPMCPIRFMDQHSPEEVAAYFEKHKHELPKSHEACVRRYQTNEQRIKELDEKYGNLVSMIQGLGTKHQPMLPEEPRDEDEEEEAEQAENPSEFLEPEESDKIKKWATAVSDSLVGEGDVAAAVAATLRDEPTPDRASRFERPLKEVRLGESPSRPWGIQVPLSVKRSPSAASVKSEQTASPAPTPPPKQAAAPPKGCPFGFDKPKPKVDSQAAEVAAEQTARAVHHINSTMNATRPPVETAEETPVYINTTHTSKTVNAETLMPQVPSTFVINGPVFIGYPMEQALELLKQSKARS